MSTYLGAETLAEIDEESPCPVYIFDRASAYNVEISTRMGEEQVRLCLVDETGQVAEAHYLVHQNGILIGQRETLVNEDMQGRGIATQLFSLRCELAIRRWREIVEAGPNSYPGKISIAAGVCEGTANAVRHWVEDEFQIKTGMTIEETENMDAFFESKNRVDRFYKVSIYAEGVRFLSAFANKNIPEDLLIELYNRIYDWI